MIDAIHRIFILLFGHPQRIDLWILGVDALIVALIAWLDIPEKFHKGRICKRVASLLPLMERGQELQRTVPERSGDATEKIEEWIASVGVWGRETRRCLEQYSPSAAAAFGLIVQTSQLSNPQYVYTESGHSFPLHDSAREPYQRLATQLNNLRSITEKPEAYF